MKSKLVSVIAAAILAAGMLTGCGGDKGASGGSPEPSSQASSQPGDSGSGGSAGGGVEEITVTAKNFEFDKKEIHVKKGDKVKLTLKNASGAHGIEIPDLGVKLSKEGTTEFTADKAGTFDFNCSVYCGTGHDSMTGKLIVE